MAAPTRVNWSRTSAGGTAVSVDTSAVPEGGWMILALITSGNIEVSAHPAGWTNPMSNLSQLAGTRRLALAYKVKSGDTTAEWGTVATVAKSAFLLWGTGAAPVADWTTGLIGVRNAANVVSGQSVQAGDSLTSVAPAVAVTAAESLVLSFLFEGTSATGAFTLTSGATEWFSAPEEASYIEAALSGYTVPAVGTTNPVVGTAVATQASNGAGVQIVIPAGAAPEPVRGFRSVGELLGKPGVTWAHRGGSADWPEMSEAAYDRCILAGYGVLEFSAQRSSDGVWIGMHDNNFDRVSGVTGSPAPSALDWATISSTYTNILKPIAGQASQPLYRLDDMLDKYTPTHVVVADPKNAIGVHNADFLNLLDAHGGPSKIIVKFSGVGTGATSLADAAKARGYQTWGYFYQEDVADGDLALWQSHWSILGMEIGADSAAWTAAHSYGKPVVGHIAQSQANYNTAIANGARMVQTAAVASVAAVSVTNTQPAIDSVRIGVGVADALYLGVTRLWP